MLLPIIGAIFADGHSARAFKNRNVSAVKRMLRLITRCIHCWKWCRSAENSQTYINAITNHWCNFCWWTFRTSI